MYRIRLASGEEAVYRTVQELAQAVASGMVSPTAEVYHKAANRWLPINTHPDYRAAIITGKQTAINPKIVIPETPSRGSKAIQIPPVQPTPPAPAPAIKPVAVPTVKHPGIVLTPLVDPPPPSTGPAKAPPAKPAAEPETVRQPALSTPVPPKSVEPDTIKHAAIVAPPIDDLPAEAELIVFDNLPSEPSTRASGSVPRPPQPDRRRMAIIGGAFAGVVLLAIIGGLLMLRRPKVQTAPAVDSVAQAVGFHTDSLADSIIAVGSAATPVPATTPPAPTPLPSVETFPTPSPPLPAPRPVVKRDSAVRTPPPPVVSRMKGTMSKTPSYYQAYADARSEMDESLTYVNFRRVFHFARLSSADSLRAAKRIVVAAGNIMRVYRGREVMLEQTYRADDPDGRNSLREPFETSQAARALLSDVDSLFSILVSQEGEMTVTETEIRFRNSRIARSYNEVRREIVGTISAWRDSAEASNRVTMPRLVQAIGPTLPPPGR